MLSFRRAARLERRAAMRRKDGRRGVLARRAWNRLVRAGDGGDQNAVREVWRAWLADLDEERWELLARWPEPAGLAARVFDEAVSPRRDASERAAIGAFCARHGLAPDGSLLAGAYQGAHSVTRAAPRQVTWSLPRS